MPLPPYELYDYKKFDFFDWDIIDIKTNIDDLENIKNPKERMAKK